MDILIDLNNLICTNIQTNKINILENPFYITIIENLSSR